MKSSITYRKSWRSTKIPAYATLSFQKDDIELKWALKGRDALYAIWDILQYLRQVDRYQDPPDDIETIREEVCQLLNNNHIDIDELL